MLVGESRHTCVALFVTRGADIEPTRASNTSRPTTTTRAFGALPTGKRYSPHGPPAPHNKRVKDAKVEPMRSYDTISDGPDG